MFLTDDLSTQVGTLALVPQIVSAVKVPVIAAGGIADARGVQRRWRSARRRTGRHRLPAVSRSDHQRDPPRGAQERRRASDGRHKCVHRAAGPRHHEPDHPRARSDDGCRSGVSAGRGRDRAAAREGGKPGQQRLLAAVGGAERSRLPGDSRGGPDARAGRPGWVMTAVVDTTIRRLRNLWRPSAAANAARLRARGEQVASLTVRDALSADIPALARLHVATWNATHRGGRSGGPSYELRERQWRDAFSQADGSWFCLVIERADGALVGFAKGSRYASTEVPEFNGELNKIYFLRNISGSGSAAVSSATSCVDS